MKQIVIIIGLVFLIVGLGYGIFLRYMADYNQEGEKIAYAVRASVEKLKAKNGFYPNTFHTPSAEVWGILPGPGMTYYSDGYNCRISHYQWPLGPYHVLDCSTNEWSYEE